MNYKLDREIFVNYEPKYKGLYSWCLNEFDENNKEIDKDLIPFSMSLYFIGSSLTVVRSLTLEDGHTQTKTTIVGTMHSGICMDGENLTDDVNYSMFGTGRKIDKFNITLSQVNEGNAECCTLVGIPSWADDDDEIDWMGQPDYVCFNVRLSNDRFAELIRLFDSRLVDSVSLRASTVRGFYSDWSPSIKTEFVKILTSEHKVEGLDVKKFQPKVVGEVGSFELNFISLSKLNLKQGFSPLSNINKEFDNPSEEARLDQEGQALVIQKSQSDDKFFNSIALAVRLTSGLKIPLWCIFSVLVLLLLRSLTK